MQRDENDEDDDGRGFRPPSVSVVIDAGGREESLGEGLEVALMYKAERKSRGRRLPRFATTVGGRCAEVKEVLQQKSDVHRSAMAEQQWLV